MELEVVCVCQLSKSSCSPLGPSGSGLLAGDQKRQWSEWPCVGVQHPCEVACALTVLTPARDFLQLCQIRYITQEVITIRMEI